MTAPYEEFKSRVRKKEWPIYHRTAHRNELKIGDSIIFYLGGSNGRKFSGSARVSSKLTKISEMDYSIGLSNIEVWKKPVNIPDVISDLEFVTRKDNWGSHFQGGVIPLPGNDYDTIVSGVKKS